MQCHETKTTALYIMKSGGRGGNQKADKVVQDVNSGFSILQQFTSCDV